MSDFNIEVLKVFFHLTGCSASVCKGLFVLAILERWQCITPCTFCVALPVFGLIRL